MKLHYWLHASRPRFWLYVLGPALLGLGATGFFTNRLGTEGATGIVSPIQLIAFMLVWLTWPANIFIYGVNDLFDEKTDQKNEKKQKQEVLLSAARRRRMWEVVAVTGLSSLLLGVLLPPPARLTWYGFLLLGFCYSAPPFRFKTKLWLDAYSNVLYVLPAWALYGIITGSVLPVSWLIVGLLWTAGMHTFSAVPDITADRAAGERTTAVRLGWHWSLFFVGLNWLAAALLALQLAGPIGLTLLVYPLLAIMTLFRLVPAERSYWWFPWINGLLGFVFFWYIVWYFR